MSLVTSLLCSGAGAQACSSGADTSAPAPETLSYGFTLPGALASPAVARAAARVVLDAHRLGDMAEPSLQAVGELAACGSRFGPGDLRLFLRYRDEELWVILHDGHQPHRNPRLASACDGRREDALRVLGCVVDACGGEWGYGDALAPGGGTRMWAVLPRAGARAYVDYGRSAR
ncbi:ATP-binding protein [Streptomyces sp. NPDC048172]|uniref:ATP-binding protein n=1 Tax=Streptomyces sp. NPDC048172 TaxID=3365505 RepID=UPI0037109B6B